MKAILLFACGDHPVTLQQRADGSFRITYGPESNTNDNLSYTQAAHYFGECVFLSLVHAGKLTNGALHNAH